MLDLHNKTRSDHGLPRLCVHPALQRAARAYSQEILSKDYFAHGNVGSRLGRYGYNWRTYGENIAWGSGFQGSPDRVFKSWINSSGHRANLLSGKFKEIGIGAANGTYKSYDNAAMWTINFGAR